MRKNGFNVVIPQIGFANLNTLQMREVALAKAGELCSVLYHIPEPDIDVLTDEVKRILGALPEFKDASGKKLNLALQSDGTSIRLAVHPNKKFTKSEIKEALGDPEISLPGYHRR